MAGAAYGDAAAALRHIDAQGSDERIGAVQYGPLLVGHMFDIKPRDAFAPFGGNRLLKTFIKKLRSGLGDDLVQLAPLSKCKRGLPRAVRVVIGERLSGFGMLTPWGALAPSAGYVVVDRTIEMGHFLDDG